MKKVVNNFFVERFIGIYKKVIFTPLVLIFIFFISQIGAPNLASANVIYQHNKIGSTLNIFRGATMDKTDLWHMYFPAGITSITPPGNQVGLIETPGIYTSTDIKYIKLSNAGGSCSDIGNNTSGPIIYYRNSANTLITYHINKFASTDGGSTCTSTILPVIPSGSTIVNLYFTGKYPNANFLKGSVNQGGQTIDGVLQPAYIKNGGIAFKLCDASGCDNEWNNEIVLEKKITSFNLNGLSPNINGVIDEVNRTVTLNVPFNTDIKALIPTITNSSGTTINPSDNTPQDFSNPVVYTVTASDMSTEAYTVNVVIDPPTQDPVILIPGIMGTELIRDYGDKDEIWPSVSRLVLSFFDNYLRDLELLSDGEKNLDYPMKIGDIIRSTPTSNIFKGLISYLITTGEYIEGVDLFVFPYDWRLSNEENAILLKEKINQVLVYTGKEKVDIVAHSMGGLVAKKYIADEGKEKIDQLVFLGTPHLGSPKAFKALMYGDDMGTNIGFLSLLNSGIVKDISQNMPSIFELLPSTKYIETFGKYISYKGIDMGHDEVKDYMILSGRNNLMFPFAKAIHDKVDNLDLSGVDVYNFANCDMYTIGKIDIVQKIKNGASGMITEDDYRLSYKIGDETVPFVSANAEDYGTKYFTKGISHANLPSADGVKETILSLLNKETPANFDNVTTTYSDSNCKMSGKVPSVHSPASMDIYDELGNHTGPNENGDIEYGIPGVSYDVIGDKKFAFLPDGGDYKVVTKALDIGSYDFYIDSFNSNDEKVNEVGFLNIPLSSLQANATVDINETIVDYQVKLDKEGDGVFESTLNPGDNAPVESNHGSSGSYILKKIVNQDPLLTEQLNQTPKIIEQVNQTPLVIESNNQIVEKIKEKINDENKDESSMKLQNKEKVKSQIVNQEDDENVVRNELSASVGLINLEKKTNVSIVVILGVVILLFGIKFIFKVK